jgi:hypothetical protein
MTINRDCLFCGDRFEYKLQRKVFCSDICRVRYNREENLRCFYCGDLADTRDHVYPHSLQGGAKFEGVETVNACRECNSMLGVKASIWIEERFTYLIDKTVRKYQLNKLIPEWSDAELNGLGKSLRQRIAGKIKQRQRALERVMHMKLQLQQIILTYE